MVNAHCKLHQHPLKLFRSNRDRAASRLAAVDITRADGRAVLNLHVAQPHSATPPGEDGATSRLAPAIEQPHAHKLEDAPILHQKVAGQVLRVEHCAIGAENQLLAVAHDKGGAEEVRARVQMGVDGGLVGGEEGVELGCGIDKRRWHWRKWW